MKVSIRCSHIHIQTIGEAIELIIEKYPDTLGDWAGKHLAIICDEWIKAQPGKGVESYLSSHDSLSEADRPTTEADAGPLRDSTG